ncbi:hypothetical protein [Streptomyces albospinus]|nr:hypothetical protein [Streptomyces albospinus]
MLREHIDRFGIAPHGRLHRNAAGNYVDAAVSCRTWARARGAPPPLNDCLSGIFGYTAPASLPWRNAAALSIDVAAA